MTREEKRDFINAAWQLPLGMIMLIGAIVFIFYNAEGISRLLIFPAALILFFSFGVFLEVISRWKEIRERDKRKQDISR